MYTLADKKVGIVLGAKNIKMKLQRLASPSVPYIENLLNGEMRRTSFFAFHAINRK